MSPATIMGPPFRHEHGTTSSPFAPASGLPFEARWVPVRHRWGRHRLAWSFPGDEVVVADGMVSHGELEEAVEDEPTATRSSAIETEHELVHSFGVARERPVQRGRCPWAT